MLDIVYCCNDKLFDGLYLSILSILRRTKENIRFTVLTAELTNINKQYTKINDYHINLLQNLVDDFNSDSQLRVIDCSDKYKQIFNNTDVYRYTPYTMLRLFIDEYNEFNDKVLYLDVDTMINQDIKQAFEVDLDGHELCACHERNFKHQNNGNYFNAGVLLFNIPEIRKTLLFKKAIKYFKNNDPIFADQDALNYSWTKIKFWDNEYRFNYQNVLIEKDTIIKHFLFMPHAPKSVQFVKQWDIRSVKGILKLHNWDADYKYYEEQKEGWEKPQQIYNIVYSCNDELFDGLYLSILSILRRTKETINFYVMTADLQTINNLYKPISQEHISLLNDLIKSYNQSNTLNILDCTEKYIKTFGGKFDVDLFTPYTLLRLFIPEFKDIDGLVLYLDVDTMINSNIKEAWEIDMNCVEMCVCHDYWINSIKQQQKLIFNCGVLLMNIDFIRFTNYFDKAINFIVKYKPTLADQAALCNTWYRVILWPDEYRFNYQKPGLKNRIVIKHFNSPNAKLINGLPAKQWNIDYVQNELNIHAWDEDYKLFLDKFK